MSISERHDLLSVIDHIQQCISMPLLFKNWSEICQNITEQTLDIRQELQQIQRPLHILLLGGTGVGKSTLLNALVGEELSPTSNDIRAFTKEFHVYHHHDVLLQHNLIPSAFIPHQHATESLLNKVIIDAPDIDSVMVDHQDRVNQILPRIDIIIYVTTWQKYKDRVCLDFLTSLQGKHSFVFLLNQIDRIRACDQQELLDDYQDTLKQAGFKTPRILGVSAKHAFDHAITKDFITAQVQSSSENDSFVDLLRLLYQQIRHAELAQLKSRFLIKRIQQIIQSIPQRLGVASNCIKSANSIRDIYHDIIQQQEVLTNALQDTLSQVVDAHHKNYAKNYHLSRDGMTKGPYGFFLKLQVWMARQQEDINQDYESLQYQRKAQQLQMIWTKHCSNIRNALNRIPSLHHTLQQESIPDTLQELQVRLDQLLHHNRETHSQAPRQFYLLNTLPISILVIAGIYLFMSLFGAYSFGFTHIIFFGMLYIGGCYGQYLWFKRQDIHHTLHQPSISKNDIDTLIQQLSYLSNIHTTIEQLSPCIKTFEILDELQQTLAMIEVKTEEIEIPLFLYHHTV